MAIRSELPPGSPEPRRDASEGADSGKAKEKPNEPAAKETKQSPAAWSAKDKSRPAPARDGFGGAARGELSTFGDARMGPLRTPASLTSDLSRLKDARQVPDQFVSDLAGSSPHLLGHPDLNREGRATRLFEFVVPYVKVMTTLATNQHQQALVGAHLIEQAVKAGLGDLQRMPDGKNGIAVLSDLVKLNQPGELAKLTDRLRFDAPSWPTDGSRSTERHEQRSSEHRDNARVPGRSEAMAGNLPKVSQQGETFIPANPITQPPPEEREKPVPTDNPGTREGRGGKLGGKMVWNVLHLFRDDGQGDRESAAQRDELSRVVWVGVLALVLLGVMIAILVAL